MSQNDTQKRTTTARIAVAASITSRPTGASSKMKCTATTVSKRGEHREADAPQDRAPELRRLRRLEVAEQHGQQQDGLETLAEDDQERLARDEQRRGEPGAREPAFGFVDDAAQLDDPVAHVVGATVTDRLAHLGELGLGVERELRVRDAQRDLDVLEVVEVALLRLLERLRVLALLEEVERLVDRDAHVLQLLDRLVLRDVVAGGAGRGREHEQRDDATMPTSASRRPSLIAWPRDRCSTGELGEVGGGQRGDGSRALLDLRRVALVGADAHVAQRILELEVGAGVVLLDPCPRSPATGSRTGRRSPWRRRRCRSAWVAGGARRACRARPGRR